MFKILNIQTIFYYKTNMTPNRNKFLVTMGIVQSLNKYEKNWILE